MKDKRIGVLMGGHNTEHEVSLNTGRALGDALRRRGYQVVDIEVDEDLAAKLRLERIEVALNALHGRWGEDGCVQGLLEVLRIPYSGSGVLASALSMDKVAAKKIFRAHGLRVIEDAIVPRAEIGTFRAERLPFGLPAVVKPSREGSSVGVSIARDEAGLASGLALAAGFAGVVLVERYVKGREISVAVLDDRALGAIEIVPAGEFYDYQSKYHHGGKTKYLVPAPIDPALTERVCAHSEVAHQALGCLGVSRVDWLLTPEGEFFLLEVNALPGMTAQSLVPKIAAGRGISFDDLAERLLAGAALKD